MTIQRKQSVKKFFPLALYRVDALADYLTEMRKIGLMFEKMNMFGVLYFKPVNPRDDLEYVILTSKRPLPWFKIKNWDVNFIKNQVHQFERNFHKILTVSSLNEFEYHIYEINVKHLKGIYELKLQRKKRLLAINIFRTCFYFFMFLIFVMLLWVVIEVIKNPYNFLR